MSSVPTLLSFFVEFWRWKYFFLTSLGIPRPSPSEIHLKKKYKKNTSLNRDIHPGDSWPYDVRPGLYLYINWTRKLYLSIFMAWDLYLATVQPRQLYLNIVQHLKNCTYCMSRPRELNQVPFRYLHKFQYKIYLFMY